METTINETVNTVVEPKVEPVPSSTPAVVADALQKSISAIPNGSVKPDPLGIVILAFGVIGVGATGYFTYKGIKFVVDKIKDSKAAQQPKEEEEDAVESDDEEE